VSEGLEWVERLEIYKQWHVQNEGWVQTTPNIDQELFKKVKNTVKSQKVSYINILS